MVVDITRRDTTINKSTAWSHGMSQSEQLKRHLCQHLKLIIKMNGWSQRDAASNLLISKTAVFEIMSKEGEDISVTTLIDCLSRAGMDIKITITPR